MQAMDGLRDPVTLQSLAVSLSAADGDASWASEHRQFEQLFVPMLYAICSRHPVSGQIIGPLPHVGRLHPDTWPEYLRLCLAARPAEAEPTPPEKLESEAIAKLSNHGFMELSPPERLALLVALCRSVTDGDLARMTMHRRLDEAWAVESDALVLSFTTAQQCERIERRFPKPNLGLTNA